MKWLGLNLNNITLVYVLHVHDYVDLMYEVFFCTISSSESLISMYYVSSGAWYQDFMYKILEMSIDTSGNNDNTISSRWTSL